MIIRTPKDLGAIIRENRRRLGLDQKALADKIGASRQWVVEVEKGKPRAEVGLLLRALKALGITLSTSYAKTTENDNGQIIDINMIIEKAKKIDP